MEKISCGGFYLGDGLNIEKDEFGRPVLNASGGGWPADLPKPSVGGYGYTEQDEQVLYDGNLLINDPVYGSDAVSCRIDIDPLEVGETYKVIWNSDEYVCNCLLIEDAIPYIGNASILGLPIVTDYPFLVVVEEGEVIVATMSAGTYSIKLSKNGDTIHKIDEKYLPSGGLPAVTAADNGKLLGVVEGEWGKVDGGGGSDSLVLKITMNLQGEYTTDKTYEEFDAAFMENTSRLVVAEIFMDGVPYPVAVIDGVYYNDGRYSFVQHNYSQAEGVYHAIYSFSENGISYNEEQ